MLGDEDAKSVLRVLSKASKLKILVVAIGLLLWGGEPLTDSDTDRPRRLNSWQLNKTICLLRPKSSNWKFQLKFPVQTNYFG